ncbi:MAG: flagellar protein FlaG [Pseudomonadota bacterium]
MRTDIVLPSAPLGGGLDPRQGDTTAPPPRGPKKPAEEASDTVVAVGSLGAVEPVGEQDKVEAIERMRAEINASGRARLQIDRDEEAGQFIYRIKNPDTGETVRQWPPETYVDLIVFLRSKQGGVIDQSA